MHYNQFKCLFFSIHIHSIQAINKRLVILKPLLINLDYKY